MVRQFWLNGQLYDDTAPHFSVAERGLLLGEGIFETMLWTDGNVRFWDAHMARFAQSLAFFGFGVRYSVDTLYEAVLSLISGDRTMGGSSVRRVIRLTVSGGEGGRGLVPIHEAPSNWFMTVTTAAAAPESLIGVDIVDYPRNALSPLTRHKTLSYFENILARRAARAAGGDEAILHNTEGRIVGGAASNLFVLEGGQLLTASLDEGVVPGVMRGHLIECAREAGFDVVKGALSSTCYATADAMIVTNAIMGCVRLAQLVTPSQTYNFAPEATYSLISSTCRPR